MRAVLKELLQGFLEFPEVQITLGMIIGCIVFLIILFFFLMTS